MKNILSRYYKITFNPEIEFTQEEPCESRPQTIVGGKIKKPTIQEYYSSKKIPQNGMTFGKIDSLFDKMLYRLSVRT